MIIIKVDIIGGSFGGLSAAISLKERKKSIDVVVHEKHKKIGYNHEGRRCGEAHTIEKEWKKWKPVGKSIFNEIKTGELIIGGKKLSVNREPNTTFVLNRQEFICQLAQDAEKLGAVIKTDDKIKSAGDLDGDYIIDASGCPSVIKREFGFNRGIKGVTYQETLEDSNFFFPDRIKIYFLGTAGYYWIFPRNPKKKEINLGIGFSSNFGYNLKEILQSIKKEHNIQGKVNYVAGGLIPLGLQRPFMHKNILFVGDACVGAFIMSGQGIYRALISGDIAGRCIAQGIPKKYSHIINKEFIKWDFIGKGLVYSIHFLRNINPQIVFKILDYYLRHVDLVH